MVNGDLSRFYDCESRSELRRSLKVAMLAARNLEVASFAYEDVGRARPKV